MELGKSLSILVTRSILGTMILRLLSITNNRRDISPLTEEGKGGDDLYSFTKQSITVELIVFDEKTQIPIEGADVFSPCSEIADLITNIDGKIYLDLPLKRWL